MDTYKSAFREAWSPLTAGALVGFINTMMFAYESPWTVFTGLRNWGLHILEFLGIGDVAQISPFEHQSSVMDIGFLLGAFGAALAAREFAIRIPPLREAIKGIIGGALMGIGANLSRGCTIGGFYSSIASMSVSGLWMMVGLFVGVVIGLKYLVWEKKGGGGASGGGYMLQVPPVVQVPAGFIVIAAGMIGIPYYYNHLEFEGLAVLFGFTAALGIINQRARFCVVRAIR
ncbi:MAG: YeeE/YedE family protein, partial [Nitrospinota bacterium]|nr:YeeE/YedE family protein [Nitrospinota bacterium]